MLNDIGSILATIPDDGLRATLIAVARGYSEGVPDIIGDFPCKECDGKGEHQTGIGPYPCNRCWGSGLTPFLNVPPALLSMLKTARDDNRQGKRDGATMGRLAIALDAAIAVLGGRTLTVHGIAEDGTLQGDGQRAPFVVFDADTQSIVAGPFNTSKEAEEHKADILRGATPKVYLADLKAALDKAGARQ